jgi:hypothetical protein
MTVIAFGAAAGILVTPLLHGLATPYGMKHRKPYPLLRRVDRAGRQAPLAVNVGGASHTMRH